MTHGSVAKAERLRKALRPADYCSDPTGRCLWNVARSGPCPKHEGDALPTERMGAIIEASDMSGAYTRSGRRPNQRVFRVRLAYGGPPIIPGSDVRRPVGLQPIMYREADGDWYPLLFAVAGGRS